jgi:hypothetical protein
LLINRLSLSERWPPVPSGIEDAFEPTEHKDEL